MKIILKKAGKKIAAPIIIILVFTAICLLHFGGAFNYLEYKSYDLRVRLFINLDFGSANHLFFKLFANPRNPSDDIVVVLVRDDSLEWAQRERGWGWPWPRQAYAEMIDFFNSCGAQSVAFDIIFSEPSVYRNALQDEIIDDAVRNLETAETAIAEGQPRGAAGSRYREMANNLRRLSAREDDNSFARAAQNYGGVVQTVLFSTKSGSIKTWPSELNKPVFNLNGFENVLDRFTLEGEASSHGALFPIPELRSTAGALGCVTGVPDSDGVIRRMRLFTMFDGNAIPGFSAASLLVSGYGNNISYISKNDTIQWDSFSVPVDKNGASLLRFRGDLNRYIPYNAEEILQSNEDYKNGKQSLLLPEDFEGTHVFIGFYAQGLFDIFNTPVSSVYPGMGAHVTMLDNILTGDFIHESRQWVNMLILFAAISITVMFSLFSHRVYLSTGGAVFAVLGIVIIAFSAYNWGNYWIPMIANFAGIFAAFISATLYNYVTEGSQKRFIKSAFSQYLSPKLIEQIIADPSQLKLGGEKCEMTAIFTDVRSFSTISEALGDPAKLVELLNYYLTRMSNIILDNQGTIDKYEGDAIIAFYGAPVHFENHASLACRSAIQMKKAEADINREALEQGLITEAVLDIMLAKKIIKSRDDRCPMFTRLGINTGDMVVGNMGTPSKMDYTIMGNAVNLAARLEGVNKQYNTGGILISENTRSQIADEFLVRPLNRVRVVGINTPLRLYELLDIREGAPPELSEMVQYWEQGFSAYEQKDFITALTVFQDIYSRNTTDFAALKYYDRCRKFISAPPDDESWDNGVDNLTEK